MSEKLTLRPIDVGFDLRLQGMAVIVTAEHDSAEYETKDGEEATVRGTPGQIGKALRKAGYTVVFQSCPPPALVVDTCPVEWR